MDVELIINSQAVPAVTGERFERLNPMTGELASTAADAGLDDVTIAVDSAQDAFTSWSVTGPGERRDMLMQAADLLASKAELIVATMTSETGATQAWGQFNVHLAAGILREAAALTTQVGGEVIPANKPNTLAMSMAKPKGVCLGIAPWNAPIILGVRALAMPIACGNTVIFKASELCPATHNLIGQVLNESGLPQGVLNVLSSSSAHSPKVVQSLIAHPAVRHVNFTGSTNVGRIIAKHAAEHLKPVLLELGGKAPFVVLDDADIDAAVNAAAFGSFLNQGQICMSTERLIVDKAIADQFAEQLSAKASALPAGDPNEHVVLGSMVDLKAAQKMEALVADAVSKGAKLLCGGERNGSVFPATLLDFVTAEMRIYQEESFGPVKPIIRVANDDEAIRVANDTEYGLSSAVFSQNVNRALKLAENIQTGICHINGPTVADEPQMPFGGVKSSGYGRFGGRSAIQEFTDTRWVTIEDPNQHYPF